jgi:hypothetical protein
MKNPLYHILGLGGILILLAVAPAEAQSSIALKAIVPFSFKVLNVAFPAGHYTINLVRRLNQDVLWLRNSDTQASVNFMTYGGKSRRIHDDPYLVFHCYGDQYFLSQVWTLSDSAGRELAESASEREVAQATSRGLAQKAMTPKLVVIAAR